MIVDTSAALTIRLGEVDAKRYAGAIMAISPCRMSIDSVLEASIVVESRGGAAAGQELDALLAEAEIESMPVTVAQIEAARRVWRCFGKGNHPAALNFGDCFAYALAYTTGEPLLFKGNDFALTDIEAA